MGKTLRVLAIVGINEPVAPAGVLWRNFEKAFCDVYSDATFVLERQHFMPWEGNKVRNFAETILEKHDINTGEEILLLGYSLGGCIATAIADRFQEVKVHQIVTVFSPHTFFGKTFSKMCGSNLGVTKAPVMSVTARFDPIVWWGSRHPYAKKHIMLHIDHLFGLNYEGPAKQIARASFHL
jgi:hypothetical protein